MTTILTRSRLSSLDKVRGLAILVMIADHVLVQIDAGSPLRYLTRIAMPLFFLLGGHLARRVNWSRLAVAFGIGVTLPMIVPWIDNPNVLVFYAVGVPYVVFARKYPVALAVPIILAITAGANGYLTQQGFYDPMSLWALMCFGALIHSRYFNFANVLPSFVTTIGRYPLSIYVSHIVLLQIVREAISR